MPSSAGRRAAATLLLSLASSLAAAPRDAASAPRRLSPRHSGTLFIALSDSLGHGTMDAAINERNTRRAFVELVAERIAGQKPLFFSQPFFYDNGYRQYPFVIPTNLSVDGSDSFSLEGLDYYKRAGTHTSLVSSELLGDRLLPYRLEDKYDKVLYPLNVLDGAPVSQLDGALWLLNVAAPRRSMAEAAVLLWIGNNDSSSAALGYGGTNPVFQPIPLDQVAPELNPLLELLLRFGERTGLVSFEPYSPFALDRNLTSLDDFAQQYEHIVSRLLSENASGVPLKLFLCTLPYYSSVGYLIDSEDLEYYLGKFNPDYSVPPSFARAAPPGQPIVDPLRGDRISLLTFGFMVALLNSGYSVDHVNGILDNGGHQRDGLVLSEAEQQSIRERIDAYNDVIRSVAAAHGPEVHLVEIGNVLNDALAGRTEVIVAGRKVSRKWARGGAFSLDGVHPGYTGQAYVANHMLSQIAPALGITTTPYDLDPIALTDPYFDWDSDGWIPGPDYSPSGISKILFLLSDADDGDSGVGAELPENTWDLISDVLLRILLRIPEIRAEAARIHAQR
jgi:hypothetical protein